MEILVQTLADGLVIGAFYGLIALGYTMVFGIIKLLNFAHGDLYMLGAFVGYSLLSMIGGGDSGMGLFGILVVLLLTMVIVGIAGMGIERIAYRPLLLAPRLSILITAIGVSLFLENGAMIAWGAQYQVYPLQLSHAGINLFGATITYTQIGLVLISALLMLGLHLFINRTLYGKAMRAIAHDQTACQLMGINVHKVIGLTFFIGASLAAGAGTMAGAYYGTVNFMMGFIIGLKAFTAAVLGGIGSIPGAMLGGLLLGLMETAGTFVFGGSWKDVVAFSLLILILVLKPTGIMGEKVTERM
ncbi:MULTISPECIES: branched-chain amino acid ABC transporter permease [Brevibacillus]|uniref:branched-chain amino acid ABC transporter permease n=1 Tax=Brevibacillus TaxID=55080 RepID=UPI00156B6E8D|nr:MULTISPECIES: branched-chain amino acid ABC transporter permease [Brevibacillus]MBU8714703.1 branched-chain amino acid ABC transporter permease [Brevibacillus parabrevis]MDH6353128.1 branched-chain amino acid transport system permease protein [Brevibacillus sp. 1238]NRQ56947.1 branched-chain amino acid ABC transporter permease [Brevibacillus sp. HD1.4A]UED67915.1 branched-chain amino acid ABC transporter permease [Brevibacillus sp. HD3.3A]